MSDQPIRAKSADQLFMSIRDFVRFMAKVRIRANGCWEWVGKKSECGYSRFRFRGSMCIGHRLIYIFVEGPIPHGLEIDHLCRNRACVNPCHLELVTHAINMRRGCQANKTHCVHGHVFTPDNVYYKGARRSCRTCRREQQRVLRQSAHRKEYQRNYQRKYRAAKKNKPGLFTQRAEGDEG